MMQVMLINILPKIPDRRNSLELAHTHCGIRPWSGAKQKKFLLLCLSESDENFGGKIPKELISLPENVTSTNEFHYFVEKINVAIPPLAPVPYKRRIYLLYNKCRIEGLSESEFVLKFAKHANGYSISRKYLDP